MMVGREFSEYNDGPELEFYIYDFMKRALPEEEFAEILQRLKERSKTSLKGPASVDDNFGEKRLKSNFNSIDIKILQSKVIPSFAEFDRSSGVDDIHIMQVQFTEQGLHLAKNEAVLICYTLSGAGDIIVGDDIAHNRKYDCTCVDCRKFPIFRGYPGEVWECAIIRLDGDFRSKLYHEICAYIEENPFVFITFGAGTRCHSIIWELLGIRFEKLQSSEKLYHLHLLELFLELNSAVLLAPKRNFDIPDIIAAVQHYIDLNYSSKISLDMLARKFNISKYHMSREFKKSIGKSPIAYLIDVRINRAKKMLYDTDIPISDIAQNVGIENPNHFLYLFKTHEGVTPSTFRKSRGL